MTWGGETLKLSGKFRRLLWCVNCFVPDYMSSKFILRSDLFSSYNLKDSENKLAVSLPRTINIEIASATAGLFCGTICPLM